VSEPDPDHPQTVARSNTPRATSMAPVVLAPLEA
jgi:hypothetical protein